jgi:hypothetical protein
MLDVIAKPVIVFTKPLIYLLAINNENEVYTFDDVYHLFLEHGPNINIGYEKRIKPINSSKIGLKKLNKGYKFRFI